MSNTRPPKGYIFLFAGPAGSGKTTCALSGDGITGYHEFDPRSFARASAGVQIDKSRVRVTYHPAPAITAHLRDLGTVQVGRGGGVSTTAARHMTGWREAYEDFINDYCDNLENPDVKQIVWDTETRKWQMTQAAWHQQMQEAQAAENKEEIARMDPLKYTEAKKRYLSNSDAAALYGKHLILIDHVKDEYVNDARTGKVVPDGMKEAPGNADLQLEFAMKEGRGIVATVRKIAGPKKFLGMEIEAPTLPLLIEFLDCITLVTEAGLEMPEEPNAVIDLAKVLA